MRFGPEIDALLIFLWKWKLATTSIIKLKFFHKSSIWYCYKRLLSLEAGGFVQSLASKNGKGFYWSLTNKSFHYLKPILGSLEQNGFLSENPGHDLVVQAVQLGNWLRLIPSGVTFFTEQQLRRHSSEDYPSWVPRSKIHRPDGYTLFRTENGNRLLAIEVELSQKRLSDYETVSRFYDLDTDVTNVLWVTGSRVSINSVQAALAKANSSERNIHSFISFSDFIRNSWQSKIIAGRYYGDTLQTAYSNMLSTSYQQVDSFDFFDFRKFPKIPRSNRMLEQNPFFQLTSPISL